MRRYRSRTQSHFAGGLLIALSVIVATGIFLYVYVTRPESFDPELCSPTGPSGVVAIAIDATDRLGEAQKLAIKNSLLTSVADLSQGSRIELWSVAPTTGLPVKVGQVFCRPPHAVDVGPGTGNPEIAKKREQKFKQEFAEELDKVLSQASSNASPIVETLQAIALKSFSTPELHLVKDKTVILASDLVQNTSSLSLLGGLPVPAQPKGLVVSLPGVAVEVLFIDRTPALYGAGALVEWWREFLSKCGAQLKRVNRV